jgi:hypothetical protein
LVSTVTPQDEEAVVLEDVGIDHRWRRRALGGCFRLDRKADTYSQGDGYGYFNSQDDGYGNANPQADGYGNANPQADGYGNANPQAAGYGNANRQGDGNPQAEGNPNPSSDHRGRLRSLVHGGDRQSTGQFAGFI